ncbi:hypothetical protein DQW77_08865 [Roseovarius sp. TE539]|uniref:DUF2484 family protein n=1 Tax=Roseovarius sp. TE539 TaxID=2249812 RepID=UPI000DDF36C4|nr:DUF2484 family protein [Roseovarius sp. TE539]RBI73503.1 hypothetical protein DQW77_08865 [Roseovarius sp. TE539]
MPISLILAFLWAILANVIAMFPSRDRHWTNAYLLIAIGVPILGFVTYQTGPVAGLLCLVAAMSVLRWPMIRLWRLVSRRR